MKTWTGSPAFSICRVSGTLAAALILYPVPDFRLKLSTHIKIFGDYRQVAGKTVRENRVGGIESSVAVLVQNPNAHLQSGAPKNSDSGDSAARPGSDDRGIARQTEGIQGISSGGAVPKSVSVQID